MRAQQQYRVRVVGGDANATQVCFVGRGDGATAGATTFLSSRVYWRGRRAATPRVASHLRLRGLGIPVQAGLVGGDADATGVAWTFLSKQDSSAGTPTLRV